MNRLEIVRSNYSSQNKLIAKNLAINGGINKQTMKSFLSFSDILSFAADLELKGQYEEALNLFSNWNGFGEKVSKEGIPAHFIGKTFFRIGSLMVSYGYSLQINNSQEEARDVLTLAESDLRVAKAFDLLAQCQNRIGYSYSLSGDYSNADAYYQTALISAESESTRCLIWGNDGINRFDQGDYIGAKKSLKRVVRNQSASKLAIANAKNCLGLIYKNTSYKKTNKTRALNVSLVYLLSALKTYDDKQPKYAISARNNIGLVYHWLGNSSTSKKFLKEAKFQCYKQGEFGAFADVSDTLGQVYFTDGNYKKALENSTNSVNHVSSDKTAKLCSYFINHAKCLARNKRNAEAESFFVQAIEIAHYLQDEKLIIKAEISHLQELFDTFNKAERLRIYQTASNLFSDLQDKQINDTLEEIKQKLASPEIIVENKKTIPPGFFDLDAETKKTRKAIITQKLVEVDWYLKRAAEILNMGRVNLKNEIERDHPELLPRLKNAGRPKIEQLEVHRIISKHAGEFKTIILSRNFAGIKKGSICVIKTGVFNSDDPVFINSKHGIKAGYFKVVDNKRYFEYQTGERVLLRQSYIDKIIGSIIGYCNPVDYKNYLNEHKLGKNPILPLIDIQNPS